MLDPGHDAITGRVDNIQVPSPSAHAESQRRLRLHAILPFLGPAFVAAIAYIDPGNVAVNIQSGAEFGYRLLWAVVLANAMAILVQLLSAKAGIATRKNLAELCREHFPSKVVYAMWGVSECAAMATDVAEFLGATLALSLIFHIPPLISTILIGVVTYLVLLLERKGYRPIEVVISGMMGIVAICYAIETLLSRPNWGHIVYHVGVPWLGNQSSLLLVVGIIGATVMPHVVYLHSGLTQRRTTWITPDEARFIYRREKLDVLIAMTVAGAINIAMLDMAAAVFHPIGHSEIVNMATASQLLVPILGPVAAGVFLVSLLSSGISSSVVGTMAGQMIMQGFVRFKIPLWLRRVVTMLPTLIVVIAGLNPTEILIISQVVLSIVLPIPVIALIKFTGRREIMGTLANSRISHGIAIVCVSAIVALNGILVVETFTPLIRI